jgi:hypothetical protein
MTRRDFGGLAVGAVAMVADSKVNAASTLTDS